MSVANKIVSLQGIIINQQNMKSDFDYQSLPVSFAHCLN